MRNMNKTLYIHIGTGKTGTTAIQNFTKSNLESLNRNHNFHYYRSHLYCKNYNNAKRSNPKYIITVDNNLEELKNNITSSDFHSFLISSECFPGEKHEEIKYIRDLLSNVCDVKIIVYLRRQDDFIWSWFAQVTKAMNLHQTLDGCINQLYNAEYILNYKKFLEPWAKVFGSENILVNTFPPNGNLIKNFFKNLDIDINENKISKVPKSNKSLTAEQIVFIQALLPKLDPKKDKDIIKIIRLPFDIDFNYTKSLISPEKRKEILNDFEEYNNNVAKKYLNRDQLFDDLSMDDEETWEYPDIIKNGYYDLAIKYLKEKHEIHIN